MISAIMQKLMEAIAPKLFEGLFPKFAKGAFYSTVCAVAVIVAGYLSNLDNSMRTLSDSIIELNGKMATVIERSDGQQRMQELHTRIIESMDRRVRALEESKK